MRPLLTRRGFAALGLFSACGRPEPDPLDTVWGGWTDAQGEPGNIIRFRRIVTKIRGTPAIRYVEGYVELTRFLGYVRHVEKFNVGYRRPTLILNLLHQQQTLFAAFEAASPQQAHLWLFPDASHSDGEWRTSGKQIQLQRLDSATNPEPKLSAGELRLAPAFELVE